MITLLTDFGEKSINAARSKAWIRKELSDHEIIEISHSIHQNDINEAVYVFNLIIDLLPQGTICFIGVDFDKRLIHKEIIYFEFQGLKIITYNNGFGTLLTNDNNFQFYHLTDFTGFHSEVIIDCFGPQLRELQLGSLSDQPIINNDKLNIKMPLKAVTKGEMLQGQIIFIDSQDTCYTNISKSAFDQFVEKSSFQIVLSRHERISKIWSQLEITEGGSTYCYFNAVGNLTISVHRGSAKRLYGLSRGHNLLIEKV